MRSVWMTAVGRYAPIELGGADSVPSPREEQAAGDADQQRPGDAALQPTPSGSCEPNSGAPGKQRIGAVGD